jgi:hypothetical protein
MKVLKIIPLIRGGWKILLPKASGRGAFYKTVESLEGLEIPERYKKLYLNKN